MRAKFIDDLAVSEASGVDRLGMTAIIDCLPERDPAQSVMISPREGYYAWKAMKFPKTGREYDASEKCAKNAETTYPINRWGPERRISNVWRAMEPKKMNLTMNIGTIQPLIALAAGIVILIMPRILNYVIAIYLIVAGLIGLSQAM